MIQQEGLSTEQRARLYVSGGERLRAVRRVYEPAMKAESPRQLGVFPFVLADCLADAAFGGLGGIGVELDILIAQRLAGVKIQTGRLQRWSTHFDGMDGPSEYPGMYDNFAVVRFAIEHGSMR